LYSAIRWGAGPGSVLLRRGEGEKKTGRRVMSLAYIVDLNTVGLTVTIHSVK